MKTNLLLFGFLMCCMTGYAQVANVSNVVTQVSDDRDKVIITYDLARKAGISAYNVSVKITLDDELVMAQALSGDVGPNISPGYGKRITWDVLKDLSELYGTLKIEVNATGNAGDCIPIKTVPVYAGLSGAAGAGATLILSGLSTMSKSDEFYDIYKNNTDPNGSIYSELSREEHYQEANKKHKTATWLMAGGGTVLVAGGVVMITRLIQINKYNKKCAGRTTDTFEKVNIKPIVKAGNHKGMEAGIAVTF